MQKWKMAGCCFTALMAGGLFYASQTLAQPPFHGTIFLDSDIITSADPTSFTGLKYAGRESRSMFDRRVEKYVTLNAYLFDAKFDDGHQMEIQVNPEFDSVETAQQQALYYAPVFGRLPQVLRAKLRKVVINKGDKPFGGGDNGVLIHTGSIAQGYIRDGILEETLVHEASHTALDPEYATNPEWLSAQRSDPDYISTYAQNNPGREDIAESYLMYLAVRFRRDRISHELTQQIEHSIPSRVAFFDHLSSNLYPFQGSTSVAPGSHLTPQKMEQSPWEDEQSDGNNDQSPWEDEQLTRNNDQSP